MHPSISKSYVVPAIFLNPILFLMSLNTILSHVLPPVLVDGSVQPPPYPTFGPSAEHPHIDIHASEGLCWGYTLFIVCAQLVAFGRVSERRQEQKGVVLMEKNRKLQGRSDQKHPRVTLSNGHEGKDTVLAKEKDAGRKQEEDSCCARYAESDLDSQHTEGSDQSAETTDSETVF